MRAEGHAPASEQLEIGGASIRLLRGGDGPPLLYLHGLAPAGEWLPLHQALARSFRVIAPDHPGFGFSPRPEWLEGMDDLVLHYEELRRHLGIEAAPIVGFSFGGWLAAELAVTYPEKVSRMVLLNAAGHHLDGALIPDLPALSREDLTAAIFHDPAAAAAYLMRPMDPEARLRQLRGATTAALLAWNPWFDPKLRRRLRRVQALTLCLWAEHDRLIPPVYGELYRDAIPGARLELLPNCGHMALVEQPEAVAAAIVRFLMRPAETAGREQQGGRE